MITILDAWDQKLHPQWEGAAVKESFDGTAPTGFDASRPSEPTPLKSDGTVVDTNQRNQPVTSKEQQTNALTMTLPPANPRNHYIHVDGVKLEGSVSRERSLIGGDYMIKNTKN